MYIPSGEQHKLNAQSDFWDSLWNEIMTVNQNISNEDAKAYLEHSIMFSLFFRGCSHMESTYYHSILNIKSSGFIIVLEIFPPENTNPTDLGMDALELYHTLKKALKGVNNSIGPYLSNRICILITDDKYQNQYDNKEEGFALVSMLRDSLFKRFQIKIAAGISSVQNIKSIYTAFTEALICQQNTSPNMTLYINDFNKKQLDNQFDYTDVGKHMFEALRMRKTEAYDYFRLMMENIKCDNTETMRNKILELLVLAAHAIRLDNADDLNSINLVNFLQSITEKEGDDLINWAYQKFTVLTGHVKPQNPIDYKNNIVQTTKEYLEAHYAEEISLEDLADQVNISPQYFSKLLKKTTGLNFIDWLSMLRVKKAKELLANPNLTIKEVCFLVGYKDPNYFSRIFKKRIGITPSEYVKNSILFNNMN